MGDLIQPPKPHLWPAQQGKALREQVWVPRVPGQQRCSSGTRGHRGTAPATPATPSPRAALRGAPRDASVLHEARGFARAPREVSALPGNAETSIWPPPGPRGRRPSGPLCVSTDPSPVSCRRHGRSPASAPVRQCGRDLRGRLAHRRTRRWPGWRPRLRSAPGLSPETPSAGRADRGGLALFICWYYDVLHTICQF